jgi:DNA transposition AAA+ family ATPase
MANEPALKEDLNGVKPETQNYDEDLHARFVLWKDQSGRPANRIAGMLGRSAAAVSQYINRVYPADVTEFEKDLASLLRREEDLEFVTRPAAFRKTNPAILIWEVLQYCDEHQKMGVALAPSGTGKSEIVNEYKRQNRQSILVTANITTCTKGPVIRMIADKTGGRPRKNTIADTLNAIIERLKDSRRLIIIDDAHFLNWEAFEAVRKIHDCAKVGVVYVGQERLYDQMKGKTNTAYLFDQIYSRIAIKRDRFKIEKKDVAMIVESLYPDIDNECIDYLYNKAKGKGRLRMVVDCLELGIEIAKNNGRAVDLEILGQADHFLMS